MAINKPTVGQSGWNDEVDAVIDKVNEFDIAIPQKADVVHTHDHGALTGLTDDDHTQYLNNTRGDARYYTKAQTDSADAGRVAKSGDIMTGNLSMQNWDNVRVTASQVNKIYPPDGGSAAQAPFASLWHDVLAFNRNFGPPTLERTADGTTWVDAAGSADNRLFAHIEDWAYTAANGTTTLGSRWTWSNFSVPFSSATWLVIGHTYSNPSPSKTVRVESWNGTAWAIRHESTYSNTAQPVWHSMTSWGGDTKVRLTILWNSGAYVGISSIRMLTTRWADQGGGSEYSYPYTWDGEGRMGIGGGVRDTNTQLTVTGRTYSSGGVISGSGAPASADELTRKDYVDNALAAKAHTPQIDVYTVGGTWTKPSWATKVTVMLLAGGGGGGSGARRQSGSTSSGGAGGGGGGSALLIVRASDLNATEPVVVGAGGFGGSPATADNTNGNPGSIGGGSRFGSMGRVNPGFTGATGGQLGTSANGGTGGTGDWGAPNGGGGVNAAAGATGNRGSRAGASGGAGGGISATPAAFPGGTGGSPLYLGDISTSAGAIDAGGSPGASAAVGVFISGGGGAGGGSSITGAGGWGGDGGRYGAGGGGGGSSMNGFASGGGGTGADGIVVVISE